MPIISGIPVYRCAFFYVVMASFQLTLSESQAYKLVQIPIASLKESRTLVYPLLPPANVPNNVGDITGCIDCVNNSAENAVSGLYFALLIRHKHTRWCASHARRLLTKTA